MQKNYELLYIVHPDLEGSTEKVTEKVAGFIKKAGGEITGSEDWGKRKLAYKIAKNEFGVYALVNFSIDSMELHLVERDLHLSEEILRSMIVVVPDVKEIILKPRKEKAEDAEEAKTEEPASIIVAEEKPANIIVAEEKPKKKPAVKKTAAKTETKAEVAEKKPVVKKAAAPKKPAKNGEADEAERLKKLDEKLDELLK